MVLGFVVVRTNVLDDFLPPSWRSSTDHTAELTKMHGQIVSLETQISELSARLTNTPRPEPVSLAPFNTALAELNDRVTAIEARPTATQGVAPNFDAEFAALQATARAQQAEIDALLNDAKLIEESGEAAAQNTLARAAMTRILAAIESGAPFAAALGDLQGTGITDIPDTLTQAASNGVASLPALQKAIPDAARAALAASRSAQTDGGGGVGGFLARQLGVRSVTPRAGSDPDAVLSRIEAAAREGRLNDALAEAETLPPEGQAAMAAWIEQAQTRNAVTSIAQSLMQRLAAN